MLPPDLLKYLFSPLQGAAANPENEDQQQRLREAAEGLRVATNAAAQNAIKKKIVNRLEVSKGWFSRMSILDCRELFERIMELISSAHIKEAKSRLTI